ncbi:putative aldo keto reductase family s protein [Rutstroemia sp. NJR-2017a BBW]|nr:putative aldo keto reductase family s protein [Rutstroemia sp. NJR-2017a BBW]
MYIPTIILALLPLIQAAQYQYPLTPSTLQQPSIGFGTWNLDVSEENTTEAVAYAIEIGYRQIDCAAAYGNEGAVGRGIREGLRRAGIGRGEVWVTGKLWCDCHGDEKSVEKGLNKTLEDLGLDYLDLYLMHWPVGFTTSGGKEEKKLDYTSHPHPPSYSPTLYQTWKSMIALPKSRVLNIGVSNFSPAQLRSIISSTGVKPFAHQMELHPYLQQSSWVATHKALGISLTAYSPLGNTNPTYDSRHKSIPALLENQVLKEIAQERNCTMAQVALKWGMGRGVSVIPKSSHREWIRENLAAGEECELGYADLKRLRFVGRKWLARFNDPSRGWGVRLFERLDGV